MKVKCRKNELKCRNPVFEMKQKDLDVSSCEKY